MKKMLTSAGLAGAAIATAAMLAPVPASAQFWTWDRNPGVYDADRNWGMGYNQGWNRNYDRNYGYNYGPNWGYDNRRNYGYNMGPNRGYYGRDYGYGTGRYDRGMFDQPRGRDWGTGGGAYNPGTYGGGYGNRGYGYGNRGGDYTYGGWDDYGEEGWFDF